MGTIAVQRWMLALAAVATALLGFIGTYAILRPAPTAASTPARAAAAAVVPRQVPRAGNGSDCRATVLTTPPGAEVTWRGQALGQTPLEVAHLPCGTGKLVIKRAAYRRIVRSVELTAESPLVVRQTLKRNVRRPKRDSVSVASPVDTSPPAEEPEEGVSGPSAP